jgi:N-acetylglucosaminyl-diphospho-decaprenol L-rhamnosyltransferase
MATVTIPKMDLSVILVSYNTATITLKALEHLFASEHSLQMEVCIVDNASRDDSVQRIAAAYPSVLLLENTQNVGFGRANNQAMPHITGRYVLLLNSDAFIGPDTLATTVAYMDQHPRCGILGAKLIGSNGDLQPSCRYFPTPWNQFLLETGLSRIFRKARMVDNMDWDHGSVRHCDWVPGCFYLVRREVIEQVGLFDSLFFMYCEEVDHCLATQKAGWDITYYPTPVIHLGGESAKADAVISTRGRQIKVLQIESELLYFRKNCGIGSLVLHMLLTTVANVLQVLKQAIRLAPLGTIRYHFGHTRMNWTLFFRTRAGSHGTR